MDFKKILKSLISIWILFHFTVIVLSPNANSYLNLRLAPISAPYLSALSMSYSWQFFAPNPPPAMYYEYEIQSDEKILEDNSYPSEDVGKMLRPNYNRRHSIKNALGRDISRAGEVLGPYLCGKYENAATVIIRNVIIKPTTLMEAHSGRALNDTSIKNYITVPAYDCKPVELDL